MPPPATLTPAQAEAQGYWQMTQPLADHEEWILQNILADLRASGTGHCIVRRRTGQREIWREGERAGYLVQYKANVQNTAGSLVLGGRESS